MTFKTTRREFLQRASLASAGFWIGSSKSFGKNSAAVSPNERLNIAVIGTANRAGANIKGVEHHNLVAICDIDDTFLDGAIKRFPEAKRYNDFRKLLEQKNIDAVVVSTADHTHAVATIAALKSGRHVYCEKPLAHTVAEIRKVTEVADKSKLVTQMGTQIHAGKNYRRVVELLNAGTIGAVKECHVWCDRSQTADMPSGKVEIPKTVHWDLWLGPIPEVPYSPVYHPRSWRAFWEFGDGTLGDMACHYLDLVFWGLKLGSPKTISAEGPVLNAVQTPPWLIVHYEFPARGSMPALNLTWYDGGKRPAIVTEGKVPDWKNGVLFMGEKGMLLADYNKHQLLPEKDFTDFVRPAPSIPDSIGHHEEWIQACKGHGKTTCPFEYAGPLSETVLLGNVAFRSGEKLAWDAKAFKTHSKAADKFLTREYRKGWEI